MCGRYELLADIEKLPLSLKKNVPKGFKENYQPQLVIRPNDPVIVLKKEGRIRTSIMLWGYISEWSKDPFNCLRPFNARAETVAEKKMFRGSWRHKRCLLPATAFLEKGFRISKIDSQPFWLGGIWSRWMGAEGSEIESCCVLTTESNELIRPIHKRMPVIVPTKFEEAWINDSINLSELKTLHSLLNRWNSKDWITESVNKSQVSQLGLFSY